MQLPAHEFCQNNSSNTLLQAQSARGPARSIIQFCFILLCEIRKLSFCIFESSLLISRIYPHAVIIVI